MGFNPSKAVPIVEDESPIINTGSFNPATAQPIPEKPKANTEPGIFAKVLRSIFAGSPLEQLQTQMYALEKIQDGTIPDEPGRRPNESVADFEKRSKESFDKMNEVLDEREKDIANEGVGRVLEAPMQLAMFTTGMAAPLETAGFVGGFTLKDHIFNARQFVESKFPNASGNVKDMAEIADLIVSGAAIGGGIHGAKFALEISKSRAIMRKAVYDHLNNLNLPTNVEVKPEHISALKKSTSLNAEEKNTVLKTLGIEDNHAQASLANNIPVKVSLDGLVDLAQSEHWGTTKKIIEAAEAKLAEYEKANVPRETPQEFVGELPKEGVAPANLGADGKMYVGKPGETHLNILEKHGVDMAGTGYVDSKGNFLNAEEALRVANLKEKPIYEGKLDSVDLFPEGKSKAETPIPEKVSVPKVEEAVEIPDFTVPQEKGRSFADEAQRFGELHKNNPDVLRQVTEIRDRLRTEAKAEEDLTKSHAAGIYNEILQSAEGKIKPGLYERILAEEAKNNQPPPTEPPLAPPQKPIDSGDTERGLSQSVQQSAIKRELVKDFGDLPSYQTRNMDEAAQKVSDFMNKDYDLAKKIALGEAPEQDGIRAQEMFTGIRLKAMQENDVNTLRDLALNEKAAAMATELGQRIKALDSGDTTDPVKAMRELQRMREEQYTKQQNFLLRNKKVKGYLDRIGNIIQNALSPEQKSAAELNKIKKELALKENEGLQNHLERMGQVIKENLKPEKQSPTVAEIRKSFNEEVNPIIKEIKEGLKVDKQKTIKDIKTHLKKAAPKRADWLDFVKNLEC